MSSDSLLRFITAGSVDDGKSTLIGRLLFDSQALMADQVAAMHEGRYKRTTEGVPDFAQLTDGLAAEREQGITIDVAYRYFATPKRKFIIADTPGHEQYTRNMVTGASTADAAIILVDATRLNFSIQKPSLLAQTKRHTALLRLLGTEHIIVAVNKLDLLDYSEEKFQIICQAYQSLANHFGLGEVIYVPISALNGDNIVNSSEQMPWYTDQPLLSILENLPIQIKKPSELNPTMLFPIQRVARQDGHAFDDFRGYQGRLEAGRLQVGDTVRIEPTGKTSRIKEIYTPYGEVQTAETGAVLTITLDMDVDVSRGNTMVALDSPIQASKTINCSLCWFDDKPLNVGRKYWLKHTTQMVYAKITRVDDLLDVHTLSQRKGAETLQLNDIGHVQLNLQQAILATSYEENRATGAFILIDDATNQTVAAGMIV